MIEQRKLLPTSATQAYNLRKQIANGHNPTNLNPTLVIEISGELDISQLETAIQSTLKRHPVLTSKLVEKNNAFFYQFTDAMPQTTLKQMNLSSLPTTEKNNRLNAIIHQAQLQPFRLLKKARSRSNQTKLFRSTLIELSEHRFVLIFSFHKILLDATSVQRFLTELGEHYKVKNNSAQTVDNQQEMRALRENTYIHAYQHNLEAGTALPKQNYTTNNDQSSLYRLETTQACIPEADWLLDHKPFGPQQGVTKRIEDQLITRLEQKATVLGVTIQTILLCALAWMHYRLTHQTLFLINTLQRHQDQAQHKDTLGFFNHMLPVAMHIDPNEPLESFFHSTYVTKTKMLQRKAQVLDQFMNRVSEDDELLSQVIFHFDPNPVKYELALESLQTRMMPNPEPLTESALVLHVYPSTDDERHWITDFKFRSDTYLNQSVEQWASLYHNTLREWALADLGSRVDNPISQSETPNPLMTVEEELMTQSKTDMALDEKPHTHLKKEGTSAFIQNKARRPSEHTIELPQKDQSKLHLSLEASNDPADVDLEFLEDDEVESNMSRMINWFKGRS